MIIVGELINASRKAITEAIKNRDVEAVQAVARQEHEAGAHYIDVNAGIFPEEEEDYMRWLVRTVQAVVEGPCSIDTPNPKAIEAGLAVHQGTPMINSISLESDRYNKMIPLLAGTDCRIVALCMSDEGMPKTAEDRLRVADKLINGLVQNRIPLENIYVDPLVQPISVDGTFGIEFLKAIALIREKFVGVHTMCGLSNVSYGLPGRPFVNQTFMSMAVAQGLDGAIINPLDKRMMANIIAAEALAGRDNFCMNFIKAHRAKKFEF
ncbi:MAG: methyltetrahydrofolate cobalamin methyltransferase [Deltaproteobacteria bacterium]|nr:methyltetrahydrofolate cobalamin methyltransferase [Deltaproteobacteria bacterium]